MAEQDNLRVSDPVVSGCTAPERMMSHALSARIETNSSGSPEGETG
jgi:hypothetical protein